MHAISTSSVAINQKASALSLNYKDLLAVSRRPFEGVGSNFIFKFVTHAQKTVVTLIAIVE